MGMYSSYAFFLEYIGELRIFVLFVLIEEKSRVVTSWNTPSKATSVKRITLETVGNSMVPKEQQPQLISFFLINRTAGDSAYIIEYYSLLTPKTTV